MTYIGPFSLDIWGIFFDYFENNYDPHTLNSLTLTCKHLYKLNKQRQNININNYIKTYGQISEYFNQHRINYNMFNSLGIIGNAKANINHNKKTLFSLHPDSYKILYELLCKLYKNNNVTTFESFYKISFKTICKLLKIELLDASIIAEECDVYFIHAIFALLKNNGDKIDAIYDICNDDEEINIKVFNKYYYEAVKINKIKLIKWLYTHDKIINPTHTINLALYYSNNDIVSYVLDYCYKTSNKTICIHDDSFVLASKTNNMGLYKILRNYGTPGPFCLCKCIELCNYEPLSTLLKTDQKMLDGPYDEHNRPRGVRGEKGCVGSNSICISYSN
jgi:hypothetical protein